MSVRVNLLPEATKAKDRAAQQRGIALLCALLLLILLGGVWFWGERQISTAEQELADEEARTAELRSDRAELVGFEELAERRERADAALSGAMSHEVSLAGILQDLAAVTPPDAQFNSLTVQLAPAPEPDAAEELEPAGTVNIAGQTLTSHAPGVERLLLSLDKISTLEEPYLNSSSLDADEDVDEDIVSFSVDATITSQARTGRYEDGLSEELR